MPPPRIIQIIADIGKPAPFKLYKHNVRINSSRR